MDEGFGYKQLSAFILQMHPKMHLSTRDRAQSKAWPRKNLTKDMQDVFEVQDIKAQPAACT